MTEIPNKLPEIRVSSIALMAAGGRWRTEAMRSYSTNLLLWFTRGQGRITVAGTTRGYTANNAVFIPAGTMHGFDIVGKVFGSAIFIPTEIGAHLPDTALHLRILDTYAQAEMNVTLDKLQKELEAAKPERIRAAHHHAGLLTVWLKRQMLLQDADSKRPNAAARLATRFTELIEDEYQTGMNVAQYAKALNVTPTHLSRVCKQACGRPASSLLSDRVIFEARRMLRETKAPINQVARELGFTSPAYFTRAFQNHTGQTPTAFRRSS